MPALIQKKRKMTAKEGAKMLGVSPRTAQRYMALPRKKWLAEMKKEREKIRAYHDDKGHTWAETAKHFKLSASTVRERAKRARKERAEEQRIIAGEIPLPGFEKMLPAPEK